MQNSDNSIPFEVPPMPACSGGRSSLATAGISLLPVGLLLLLLAYCVNDYFVRLAEIEGHRVLPLRVVAVDDKIVRFSVAGRDSAEQFQATLVDTVGKDKPMLGEVFRAILFPQAGLKLCSQSGQCFGAQRADALLAMVNTMPTRKELQDAGAKARAAYTYQD